ncbi:MAG: IS1 family transposase [Candidatus Polarisedimenticolia bacterium]
MNKLSTAERARIVAALVEGNSIRATCRMTGAAKGTVLKLLKDIGEACERFHDEAVRGVKARRVQCDEIWQFCYAKAKNVPADKKGIFGYGDCWTWTALDADSKLIVSWLVGTRDAGAAFEFMQDVADRLDGRVQLTTDGHKAYLEAVEAAFGADVDYAQLVKIYGTAPGEGGAQVRYSPVECLGAKPEVINGHPKPEAISTSYVERQNLTMRMSMRRFTRLTNAFSKKVDNLRYAVALHFVHYNFARIHQTLRVTPAMEAGLTDHVWTLAEIVGLLEKREAAQSAGGSK